MGTRPVPGLGGRRAAALVFCVRPRTGYAFRVLAGALESAPEVLAAIDVRFASSPAAAAGVAAAARCAGQRVAVLWSFHSSQLAVRAVELDAFRDRLPDAGVLHVAGGPHATARSAETLASGFDLAARGEGEPTIVEIGRRLAAGAELDGIPGLARLEGERLVANRPGPPVDLDDYPPFSLPMGKLGPIEITRGCVFACRFCQVPWLHRARFRHRSVDGICRWVEAMRAAEVRDVRFLTPSALSYGSEDGSADLAALERLLATVKGILGEQGRIYLGSFPSEVRPEHVSREALELLRRFVANDALIIGGQSGSERVLAATHRGHGVGDIERAVRLSLAAGFRTSVDLILGLPGEEPADTEATLALAERLVGYRARVHAHAFMPLPGTPLSAAPPARISSGVQLRLERLASRGGLYGQWRGQMAIGRGLAASGGAGGGRKQAVG